MSKGEGFFNLTYGFTRNYARTSWDLLKSDFKHIDRSEQKISLTDFETAGNGGGDCLTIALLGLTETLLVPFELTGDVLNYFLKRKNTVQRNVQK